MKDPVIEELWRTKDQIAEQCDNDIDKLVAMIRRKEKKERARVVDLSKADRKKR